jgi:hypothetical protein
MAIYQHDGTSWVMCTRPYVMRSGVWVAGSEAYVKRSGAWVRAYEYDVTPPNPPEITLSIAEDFDTVRGVKTLKTRYIRVGVRLPGASNDPDARLARVLTDYGGKAPTTQFGGTYTSATDASYPTEAWSNWEYNDYGVHKDTSVYAYKQWPRNASAGTIIKGDQTYHFGGWSLDANGNWSTVNQASIHVPKSSVDVPNVVTKEARFQPNSSGSWRSTGFQTGKLIQQKSPRSVGMWFYGNQFTDSIGAQTTGSEKITVKSAQILIRRDDDTGSASANVYLFWNGYGTVSSLPAAGSAITKHEITKLGTLAKGQAKWFDLPTAFKDNLNTQLKGMGLDWKDPVKADAFPADYSSVPATATSLRCGEVHVVWEEEL